MSDDKIEVMRIVTRGYELSANGSIGPAQFLRFLEHIRWTTIATSERLPFRKFWGIGVVRSQVVEIDEAVTFNEALDLSVWLSRVGRTSMDLSHDIVRADAGKRIGRSSATLVSLDGTRRPAPIGDGAREYVILRDALVAERLDATPPKDAWERSLELRPSDHDLQQHVNHARYADLVEDTRLICAGEGGYGSADLSGRCRKLSIVYDREVRRGDPVVMRTWITPGRERTLDFALMRGPDVAMRARVEVAP